MPVTLFFMVIFLVLIHNYLFAPTMLGYRSSNFGPFYSRGANGHTIFTCNHQDAVQVNILTRFYRQSFYFNLIAFGNAVLFTASFNDRIHTFYLPTCGK